MKSEPYHEPVMVDEVLKYAHLKNQARIIDATVGTAGHSLELVKSGVDVLGIEADGEMIEIAEKRLKEACPTPNKNGWGSFKLVHANFRNIDSIAEAESFTKVDTVLFDLGTSNLQLTSKVRGFSFLNPDAELDMRIDASVQALKGSDLLNGLREDQLRELFAQVISPFAAQVISRKIVDFRKIKMFSTVGDFLKVCEGIRGKPGLSPATLPFLALRIAVNSELENLSEALPKAFDLLKKGGRLLVIAFHSGERKVVLDFFFDAQRKAAAKVLTENPIVAAGAETDKNPRSRSAELYVLEKI